MPREDEPEMQISRKSEKASGVRKGWLIRSHTFDAADEEHTSVVGVFLQDSPATLYGLFQPDKSTRYSFEPVVIYDTHADYERHANATEISEAAYKIAEILKAVPAEAREGVLRGLGLWGKA